MTPRMINSASTISSRQRSRVAGSSTPIDFASIGRVPLRLALGPHGATSRELQIVEAAEELLEAEIPEPDGIATNVSLLKGFNATIPSADLSRARRRQMRSIDTPKLGLKRLGMTARGMITEDDSQSIASEEDVVLVSSSESPKKGRTRGRTSLSAAKKLGKEELSRQAAEIARDKENLHVRRVCLYSHLLRNLTCFKSLIHSEIDEITHKIEALKDIRAKLEADLIRLQEDDLELDAECTWFHVSTRPCLFHIVEGVKERVAFEQSSSKDPHLPSSSRRRKGMPTECCLRTIRHCTHRTRIFAI